jgi:SAM-dependent methyltransferase
MLPRPLAPPPERRARSGPRWWESNKRPQIEVMLALVEPFVRRHAAAQAALAARRPLCVLDIGGGKGSLAAALAERFGAAVDVTVVDVAAAPLAKGAARAEQRGDGNVRFVRADASVFAVDTDGAAGGGGVDLVVALHACGALSDVALAQAVRHGCGFVICPCCFRANGQLRIPVGPADARAAQPAALAPAEWLGVSAESLGALLHAAELQGDHAVAARAAHATCALRAEAAVRRWADAHGARERGSSGRRAGADRRLAVRIVQFPIAFSTRNRCLVGMPVADDREDDTVSDWS